MKVIADISTSSAPHRARHGWNPGWLFRSGAQGVWYDPSDLSTLFQDTTGTISVTLPGQAVARMNDKSGNGNHAVQVVSAARPVFAVIPSGGRRNLSDRSEPNVAALAYSAGVSNAVAGLAGFDATIQFSGGTVGDRIAYRNHGAQISTKYTLSCFVRMDDDSAPVHGTDFSIVISNAVASSSTAVPIGGGLWRVSATRTVGPTAHPNTGVYKSNSHSVKGFRVSGFQLESGATMTPYQRARSAYDITEAGVTSLPYLFFDGVDDKLTTNSIDLTVTDKVTLCAGVQKAGNPTIRGTVINFADNGLNIFSLEVPMPGSTDTRWLHAGNSTLRSIAYPLSLATPVIYSGLSDLGAPLLTLRSNGVVVATSTDLTGGGNFKSGPLAIGDYATPSGRFFSGSLFGLILVSQLVNGLGLTQTERFIASRTGVSL